MSAKLDELIPFSEAHVPAHMSRQSFHKLHKLGRGPQTVAVEDRLYIFRRDLRAWIAGRAKRKRMVEAGTLRAYIKRAPMPASAKRQIFEILVEHGVLPVPSAYVGS